MVDAHAVDRSGPHQRHELRVGRIEHVDAVGPQRDERVDVKAAPIARLVE